MVGLKIVDGRVLGPETEVLEFKNCRKALSRDFWPTYSAMANTFGGTIVLGIDDDTREVIGVDDTDKVTKELWDLLNDPKKVSSNLLSPGDVRIWEESGRALIFVRIPRAERMKRPVYINGSMENGTYKRNGEGDYHCSVSGLRQMLRESSDSSQDSVVLGEMLMDDLDKQSVTAFRNMMSNHNPAHPWNSRDDNEFLRLMGAASRTEGGSYHPTVAGLLMFGYDISIMSVFPNYHLDYLEFGDGTDRWTFRITTGSGEFSGNVFSFVIQVSNRISMMNNRGKDLDGMVRIDDTQLIRAQRELLINALIHSDYNGIGGVRAEWRLNEFSVRNPGNLRIPLKEMFAGGVSDPRNPRLALMMNQIGMRERAGSGVSDVVSICRSLGIPDPVYDEASDPDTVTARLRLSQLEIAEDNEKLIKQQMRDDPTVSLDALSKHLGMEKNRLVRLVNSMKSRGIVERVGGTRGRWVVRE